VLLGGEVGPWTCCVNPKQAPEDALPNREATTESTWGMAAWSMSSAGSGRNRAVHASPPTLLGSIDPFLATGFSKGSLYHPSRAYIRATLSVTPSAYERCRTNESTSPSAASPRYW